jgi:hypothetical protein
VCVVEPGTGELVPLGEASDRAILEAEAFYDEQRSEAMAARRALGEAIAKRHGFGAKHRAGFAFKIEQTRSWPQGSTEAALRELLRSEKITQAEFEDAMPWKRSPDGRKCKSLGERLMMSGEIDAAKRLMDACSVSAPVIKALREEAVRGDVAGEIA